jgi:hypothetical protein
MNHLFQIFLLVALFSSSVALADQPPKYYLKITYSLKSEKNERKGVIYNNLIDPEQSEQYLNDPNKLLDRYKDFESDLPTITVFDDILLYKFPLHSSFDGMASFYKVKSREIALKDVRSMVVTRIYAVNYDGALHSALSKEDLTGWANKDEFKLIDEIDGGGCFFRLYRYSKGNSGTDVIEQIKKLVSGIDYRDDWKSKPKNSEYLKLVNRLREYQIIMIEYCDS